MNDGEFIEELRSELDWPDALGPDTTLKGHEKWDSAAMLAAMMLAEDKYGVTLRARDLDGVTTVADLLGLIAKGTR